MTKAQLIEHLVNNYQQDKAELEEKTPTELKALLDDLTDHSDMYPNGRDYDAENEDGF